MTELVREVRFFLGSPADGGNAWSGHGASWHIAPLLVLRATVRGTVHQPTGYLCDIRAMDERLRAAVNHLAHDDVARIRRYDEFLLALAERLSRWKSEPVALVGLELIVSPWFSMRVGGENWTMLLITRQFEFSAAHRLHCDQWSEQHNRDVFGKCNNPAGHGHNYVLDVVVAQPANDQGQPISLSEFDRVVKQLVIDRLDHKHLNHDVAEFAQLNPTVENIAQTIWTWLDGQFAPAELHRVRVYETRKTWAEVCR